MPIGRPADDQASGSEIEGCAGHVGDAGVGEELAIAPADVARRVQHRREVADRRRRRGQRRRQEHIEGLEETAAPGGPACAASAARPWRPCRWRAARPSSWPRSAARSRRASGSRPISLDHPPHAGGEVGPGERALRAPQRALVDAEAAAEPPRGPGAVSSAAVASSAACTSGSTRPAVGGLGRTGDLQLAGRAPISSA